MRKECWVTKLDHEQEAVDKAACGVDATIMKAVGVGVPVYCITPTDSVLRVSNRVMGGVMPLPSGRELRVNE